MEIMKEEVKKTTKSKEFYFKVFTAIKKGKAISSKSYLTFPNRIGTDFVWY